MRFRVFYEVPSESAVAVAEHVISRLASAYCTMGGFNGHQAGISISSSGKFTAGIYRKVLGRLSSRLEDNLRNAKAQYEGMRQNRALVNNNEHM